MDEIYFIDDVLNLFLEFFVECIWYLDVVEGVYSVLNVFYGEV